MTSPYGVRVRLLVGVAAIVGALAWVGLRLWTNAGHPPPVVTWAALPILIVVAVALYLTGRPVKKLVDGTATKQVHPLYAARVLAFAQAAALTGAAVVGWYLAQAVLLLPDSDVSSQQEAILQVLALALGAAAMSASGLLVQHMCRVDRGDKDDRGGPPSPRGGREPEAWSSHVDDGRHHSRRHGS